MTMTSPSLVLPSKIRPRSLVAISSFSRSVSCFKVRGMCWRKWELFVNLFPPLSRRSWSLSILYNGTPAFKKSSTTCTRNARTSKGKVLVCNRQLALSAFNASVMVTSLFFDLTSFSFPWACFLDLQWFCKMLFLVDSNSRQVLQNSFPPLVHKFSLGKDCSLSCKPIFLYFWHQFSFPVHYLPWVDFWNRSLAVEALCGPWPGRTTWFLSSES